MLDLDEVVLETKKGMQTLERLKEYLFLEQKRKRLQELEDEIAREAFWDNPKNAEKVLKEQKNIVSKISKYEEVEKNLLNIQENTEIAKEAEQVGMQDIVDSCMESIREEFEKFKIETEKMEMLELIGDASNSNAIITIHAGAGGTEACDWADMLYRMYYKWATKEGYSFEIIDMQAGDTVGIKSITFIIAGEYVSELLKGEMGVHRLVRISPFDSSARRHTSFASVEVLAEAEDLGEIQLDQEDLRIDTYRASGAGGQHVNKTESAVRIVHIPTGIVVTCQAERSQIKNREKALKVLKSKLKQKAVEEEEERIRKEKGEEKEIGWGSQIRSYVFQPYSLVKDHRTNTETGNVLAVMNGEINEYIYRFLVYMKKK